MSDVVARGGHESVEMPAETDDGETFGTDDKRVVSAEIELQGRAPGPARRVLSVETDDGWTYRFQRYGSEEPWVRYDRVRPDGEVKPGLRGRLPESVQDYADAVDHAEILPPFEPMIDAVQAVGEATLAVVTDGGQDVDESDVSGQECRVCEIRYKDEHIESSGLCVRCAERERQETAHVEQQLSAHPTIDDPTPPGEYGR